ncbi:MbcA/ParS/Xre antitoxin family protein [Parasphingorhabdus sp.]|uniref:MbcA/ParS/Xre antitoxin family protein n=1 Tax=Parasphingorhabdus sp. TaxID=2709688 RepID=UPI002B27050D|nr:MbcA/ParS/Xre antitoxin family protein [Parasphingorhabdus sp.]|tara:strand:- start:104 stop:490 length:387 start_codon:yes stop_codon:yes gene_type:complete
MTTVEPIARAGDGQIRIPVGMDAFQRLAELWQLSTEDQILLLGSPGRSTFFKWKKDGGTLPRDTNERISHLLAIFKALEIMLPDERAADGWIRRANHYFHGQSALDVMLNGQIADILRVRQYVDAQRG